MKLSINRLIKLIPEWNGKSIRIESIDGGITNTNYKIMVDEEYFFLSIPGPNPKLLNIDYGN